ncbi:hypothetical protein AMTRI_Chr08g209210 [Amborella trichopoda]
MAGKSLMDEVPATRHFVLVHGFCHGAWCWHKTGSLLKNSVFKVTAVDLGEYNKPLIDLLSAKPEDEKVSGGLSLTHATRMFGERNISLCQGCISINCLCNPQDFTLASMLLRPGPTGLFSTKCERENSGDIDKVNRVYLKTTKDDTSKPNEHQEQMIKRWPPNEVMSIDTSPSQVSCIACW